MRLSALAATLAVAALFGTPAFAVDHQVQMLNHDSQNRSTQFEPAFLKIAPGDTVTFVATNKGHDSESIDGGIPTGATAWKGKMSTNVTVTFTTPGLYAYRCTPHFGLGMVGLVEVGDAPTNLAAIQALNLPGKAATRMKELLAEAGAK